MRTGKRGRMATMNDKMRVGRMMYFVIGRGRRSGLDGESIGYVKFIAGPREV